MLKNRVLAFLMIVMFLSLFMACNEPIPSKDLQAAKQALADAKQVNSEKYDLVNYKKAAENYKKALRSVVDDDNELARKMAVKSKKDSYTAIANTRRKISVDSIREAHQVMKKAKKAKADIYAPELFKEAKKSLVSAKKKLAEGKFVVAFTHSENTKEKGGQAIDRTTNRLSLLNRAFSDAERNVSRAKTNSIVQKFAPKKLVKLVKLYDDAKEDKNKVDDPNLLNENNHDLKVKKSNDLYNSSLKKANEVKTTSEDIIKIALLREREFYKLKAQKKIQEAEKLLKQLEQFKKKGLIKELMVAPAPEPTDGKTSTVSVTAMGDKENLKNKTNLEKYKIALKALQMARDNMKNENFKVSIKNAEEAIRVAKLVKQLQKKIKKTYKVRLILPIRDCLWRIANYKYVYNNAALWPKIWKANKKLIKDPDLIYPGQVFVIPANK